MKSKNEFSVWVVIMIVVCGLAAPVAMAQDAAPPSLKEQLEAQYKTSKISTNGGVQDPGVVLVVQQNGAVGVPLTDAAIPALGSDLLT